MAHKPWVWHIWTRQWFYNLYSVIKCKVLCHLGSSFTFWSSILIPVHSVEAALKPVEPAVINPAWVQFSCYYYYNFVGAEFWFSPLCLVCFAVWKNRHMRTVTNYFIVNLSFADVLVTIICLPASLVVDITETWFFGNTLCKIVPYLQVGPHFATENLDLICCRLTPPCFLICYICIFQSSISSKSIFT